MHSLAIALKEAGHEVSGSDDQIYDPARSKLEKYGILPKNEGWDPNRIDAEIEVIILGMHALSDNPELQKARALGIPTYSFPEFIYQHSQNKHRIVIAGSYGKTTVSSMIIHVLEKLNREFDYLVGASLPGLSNSVRLSEEAPMIILEGDEYLASKLDPRPKFLLYKPHMVVINGISWDHINVFETEEIYDKQFELLLDSMEKAGTVIYNKEDAKLAVMAEKLIQDESLYVFDFSTPKYEITDQGFVIELEGERKEVGVIGKHNMQNIRAAWKVCQLLGVEILDFLEHISTFTGAKLRLEKIHEDDKQVIFKDFAHAPAKVEATVEAVREKFKSHNMIACVELHTFSSLNHKFLPHYKNTLQAADHKIVFVNPHATEKRKMKPIVKDDLSEAFGEDELVYVTNKEDLLKEIAAIRSDEDVVLMMSSGNFGGLDWNKLTT